MEHISKWVVGGFGEEWWKRKWSVNILSGKKQQNLSAIEEDGSDLELEHAKKDWIYGFPEKVRDTESRMNYVVRNKSLLSSSWVMEAICGRFKGRNKLSITVQFLMC